jgi:leucyl aminopeptidase
MDDEYLNTIDSSNADLCNRGTPAGSACAAIFLKQFVEVSVCLP